MPVLTRTLVTATLTASAEHVTAFAHNLGGDRLSTKEKRDRIILTFAFNSYANASSFRLSLGSVRGFVSAAIAKQ